MLYSLSQTQDKRDLFQSVMIFDISQNLIFILYHYADGLIQWAEGSDDPFASVGVELCGGEVQEHTFVLPNSGSEDIIDQVLGANIPNQTDVGKLVFLIADDTIIQHGEIEVLKGEQVIIIFLCSAV